MNHERTSLLIAALGLLTCGSVGIVACADDATTDAAGTPETRLPDTEDASATDLDASDADAFVSPGCEASNTCTPPAVDCATVDFCAVSAPIADDVVLNGVWGSSASDVWIVGSRGTILRGNGTTFSSVPSGTNVSFYSVVGTASADVWIVPSRAPMHSKSFSGGNVEWETVQGESWVPGLENEGRTWALWASSRDSVWMGGVHSSRFGGYGCLWSKGTTDDGGVVWNATDAWRDFDSMAWDTTIRALWGSGPNDTWAVGTKGDVFHYEAETDTTPARWLYRNSQTNASLGAIWGTSATDIWVVGEGGTIRHSTGASANALDVVPSPTTSELHAIWGSGPNDVWAVGDEGTLIHWDGSTWSLADAGLPANKSQAKLFGIWGSDPNDVWIVGEGVVLHRTAQNRKRP